MGALTTPANASIAVTGTVTPARHVRLQRPRGRTPKARRVELWERYGDADIKVLRIEHRDAGEASLLET
jgi:hypothetical protein